MDEPVVAPGRDDVAAVTHALGRAPAAAFSVVVRGPAGEPWVLRNAPYTTGLVPMPTRFWLLPTCADALLVGWLESAGGVRRAEREVPADEIAAAHARYAAERDREADRIAADHALTHPDSAPLPRPSGGVGGTRRGVKCLHAHYAHHLAGGDDAVGRWVAARIAERRASEHEAGSATAAT